MNWKFFKDKLSHKIDLKFYSNPVNLNSKEKVDEAILSLSELILATQETTVPKSAPKKIQNELIFPDELKQLIRLRNTRRRQWQRLRLRYLKPIILSLNKKIENEIQLLRNQRWDKALEGFPLVIIITKFGCLTKYFVKNLKVFQH